LLLQAAVGLGVATIVTHLLGVGDAFGQLPLTFGGAMLEEVLYRVALPSMLAKIGNSPEHNSFQASGRLRVVCLLGRFCV
jgi:hypothetical protein